MLDDARAQSNTLADTAHRPWPLPDRPWLMGQTWHRLLFAHWRVPVEDIRAHVPRPLAVDTFDGNAWIGVTPFVVTGLRLRTSPPPPLVSSFPELNVRTYVTYGERPGIWFFSLDAGSAAAVLGARAAYRLPYFRARMSADRSGDEVDYTSDRLSKRGAPAAFRARYRPTGAVFRAEPGSLEWFLAERYCLYTVAGGHRLDRAEIHHPQWPLQPAEADIAENTMAAPLGIELSGEPLLHLADRQDVVIWRRRPVC